MEPPLIPGRWAQALRREWRLRQLKDPAYAFLFEPAPPDEWVSLACATSGHDLSHDQILSVCALRVSGQQVLASERLELLLKPTRPVPPEALRTHRLGLGDASLVLGFDMVAALADDSFRTLAPGQWLNDEVINFHVTRIAAQCTAVASALRAAVPVFPPESAPLAALAARIRAMPPAEPEPGWEERARHRYQETSMSIEITDCASRGKVYHNVKLLDGRRALDGQEVDVIDLLRAVAVDQVEVRAADALDGRDVQLHRADPALDGLRAALDELHPVKKPDSAA